MTCIDVQVVFEAAAWNLDAAWNRMVRPDPWRLADARGYLWAAQTLAMLVALEVLDEAEQQTAIDLFWAEQDLNKVYIEMDVRQQFIDGMERLGATFEDVGGWRQG